MTDLEVEKQYKKKHIFDIASKLGLTEEDLELYGNYKAKVHYNKVKEILKEKPKAKTILVTAITPTAAGEGKTLTSIGLADALNINKKVCLALREPSLGPCLGVKGGAAGGGYSQITPMEDINLHFTGDLHAITAANNLISSLIDNHIFQGNELKIKNVTWRRCLDLNDRALRKVNLESREESFSITAASEIMAILGLSNSVENLRERVGNIVIGQNDEDRDVLFKELGGVDSVLLLLKNAICPNIVQTLEGTPAFIHCGPFANIAYGCNSIIATGLAQRLADYVVTEAGFASDLGMEKFIDIKCRNTDTVNPPDCIVLVATIRALKLHGGANKNELDNENVIALEKGFENLAAHIDIVKQTGIPFIIAINKFASDTKEELDKLQKLLEFSNVEYALTTNYSDGGIGSLVLAVKVETLCNKESKLNFFYDLEDNLITKIRKLAANVYRAKDVMYSDDVLNLMKKYMNYKCPICVAKTQNSISDNKKLLGDPAKENYVFKVTDVKYFNGAGFIVVFSGSIIDMPGLPKTPLAYKISVDDNFEVFGLS